jgi:hypothetical protein
MNPVDPSAGFFWVGATDEVLVGVVRPSSPCSAGTFSRTGEGNFLLAIRYSLFATRSPLTNTPSCSHTYRTSSMCHFVPG